MNYKKIKSYEDACKALGLKPISDEVFNVFGEENLTRFNIQEGQELTVSFDINAREYNGRW